jgi:nucleoside-diphosphate-sugar epimerase
MANLNNQKLVLVTGGTGFVGSHCVLQLLNRGYRVRTTLRSLCRKDELTEALREGGAKSLENLSFIEADLSKDKNWDEAIKDCDYVLHVASPITLERPKDENELIGPAVEGTLRVLRAAKTAGVKRVVLTSSFGAIGYGHKPTEVPFTEESWTDTTYKGISAYVKSKTLAEKAAWDFIRNEGRDLELSVINPTGIFGPLIGSNVTSSLQIIQQLMNGTLKATPNMNFGIVDVRDVADAHIRAMEIEEAKGQRFILQAGKTLSIHEVAMILREKMGDQAKRVPTKVMPNWLVRISGLFNSTARTIIPQLGQIKNATSEKARRLLDWKPRTNEEAIVASAESVMRLVVTKQPGK